MVALNFAMEEENNELRRIICQQQLLPCGDVNNNPIEPSTNQAEENAQDADLKPKEWEQVNLQWWPVIEEPKCDYAWIKE